jgi:hypothetical protein
VVFLREKIIYHLFMVSLPSRNKFPFDRPATYQISVQGRIDPTWSDRLEGMTICQATVEAVNQLVEMAVRAMSPAIAGCALFWSRLP